MERIRLSSPDVGPLELGAVERVFASSFLCMASEVHAFEQELKDFIGREVVCVSSCTTALLLSVQAIGICHGDEVLVPTITYVATFQAVTGAGGVAVACDVDPLTGLLDVEDARKRITPRTKAIIYVHYASQFSSRDAVYALAKEYGLRVIEDAAHSFGSLDGAQRVGAQGDIVCFSFDNIKNITCGDGGAIVTSDPKVINHVQDARLLGVEGDTQRRINKERSVVFDVHSQGWRFHMNDVAGAIGRIQLKRFDELHKKRIAIMNYYLAHLPSQVCFPLDKDTSPHIFPILIKDRNRIYDEMESAQIQTGKHYYPNHWLSFFKTPYSLPQAEKFFEKILTIPLHPKMTEDDAQRVVDTLCQLGAF